MSTPDEQPAFDALDGADGPALPLPDAQALAMADALVARARAAPRVARMRRLTTSVFVAGAGALAAVAWWNAHAPRDAAEAAPPSAASEPSQPSVQPPIAAGEPDSQAAEPPTGASTPSAMPVAGSAVPPHTPRDWLELANLARARLDFARAERLYLRVATLYPGTDDAFAAMLAAADLRREHLGRMREAIQLYRKVIERGRGGALAEQARAGVARAFAALGEREAERAAWRELLEQNPQTWFEHEARQRLASDSE